MIKSLDVFLEDGRNEHKSGSIFLYVLNRNRKAINDQYNTDVDYENQAVSTSI